MTLPDALSEQHTAALRDRGGEAPPPVRDRPRRMRQVAKNVIARVEARLLPVTSRRLDASDRRLEHIEQTLAQVRELPVRQALAEEQARTAAVNTELLKGEVRDVRAAIDRLALAIAPAAGLDGVADRLAELRERLNGLDRRLRQLATAGGQRPAAVGDRESPVGSGTAGAGEPAAPGEAEGPASALFDYVGFERRFRGEPQRISDEIWSRYGALLSDRGPVLDVGCGSGELVARLTAAGVPALGVDTDPSMVAEARGRGLEVHLADAAEFLATRPPHSLGAVVAIQVVEHLPLATLVRLLDLAVSRLRPGGVFVAETPNPESLIVLGNSYILDPTHVWPMHPSLMVFLCENAGFRDVRLQFFAPAEAYHLPPVEAPSAPELAEQVNASFAKLNRVLFGPQDYAVIATTPGQPGTPS